MPSNIPFIKLIMIPFSSYSLTVPSKYSSSMNLTKRSSTSKITKISASFRRIMLSMISILLILMQIPLKQILYRYFWNSLALVAFERLRRYYSGVTEISYAILYRTNMLLLLMVNFKNKSASIQWPLQRFFNCL